MNLANLSKEETADMHLEIRAQRLIYLGRLGEKTRQDVIDEVEQVFDQEVKKKFKFYLNKYDRMMKK